jgi:succinate dehydrogenase / fumarate reductase cytochrome b subunit
MTDRTYFVLKRLHSLSGVVPIAGFVAFHLFENSNSVLGADKFNETVHTIRSMPYLSLLEVGLLAPILFHALMGVYLVSLGKRNTLQYPTRANWSYTLQRVTGMILLFFIAFHVYTTRFAGIASDQMFQYMAGQYAHAWISGFYVLGILSAAFHLSNGLWGFLVAWGIVTGEKSMDLVWKGCMGLGLGVALMGLNALAGFHGSGVKVFFHQEPASTSAAQAPAAAAAAPVAASTTAQAKN